MKTQYITDDNGKKVAVILPMKEYKKMLEESEELEDIRLYDAAKKTRSQPVEAEEAFKEIDARRRKRSV